MYDPVVKIETALNLYDFYPVTKQLLANTHKLFQASKVIKSDFVSVEFLMEILPQNCQSVELLYQHTS